MISKTPEDAELCALASAWEREAFKMPWILGEPDPRARALRDCADDLRRTVVRLFRSGEESRVPLPHGIALAALECIRQAYEPGTMAHDTALKALDDTQAAIGTRDQP